MVEAPFLLLVDNVWNLEAELAGIRLVRQSRPMHASVVLARSVVVIPDLRCVLRTRPLCLQSAKTCSA